MNIFSTLNKDRRRSLLLLAAASLLFWSNMGSLLPTLPLYVQHIGGNKQEIGLVMGGLALGLLPSRIWLGPMADRRGRKMVLLLGTTVSALAPFGYFFFQSIPLLIILRAFQGISIAAFTTAYSALVADLSPPKQRGELIGYMSLVQPIGVAVGPALAGFLLKQAGYSSIFLISTALGFLSMLGSLPIPEPTPEIHASVEHIAESEPEESFWQVLWSERLRIPTLVMLLIGLVFGTLSTFVPLYIKETKIDFNAGLFYTCAAIASFSVRLLAGRGSDRYGRGVFITSAIACYVLAMLVLWNANSRTEFMIAAFLEGAGAGKLFPSVIALISDRCLPKQRGQFFSVCVGGFDLGMAIAGPTFGGIADLVGLQNMFALAALLAIFAFFTFVTQSSNNLRSSLKFALGLQQDVYALNRS